MPLGRSRSRSSRAASPEQLELANVVFETTSRCNLDCRYCYAPWKRPGAAAPPPSSYRGSSLVLDRLFDQARVRHVAMSGGEPFLSERFAELVLRCRMRGVAVTIISNGNAASRDDLRQMVELGVGTFEFPLHSPAPEAHDRMTGTAGSWQRARASIESVIALGGHVAAVIVVSRVNHGQIGATLELLRSLGVRRVLLNRFNVGGSGIANRSWLDASPSDLGHAFAAADHAAVADGMTITANVCTPWCLVDPKRYPHVRMSSCAADPRRMPLTLDGSGALRLCNHSPAVVGNILHQPIDVILRSRQPTDWQRIVPSHCEPCADWSGCRGGCRAAAEQLGGTLRDADPAIPTVAPAERWGRGALATLLVSAALLGVPRGPAVAGEPARPPALPTGPTATELAVGVPAPAVARTVLLAADWDDDDGDGQPDSEQAELPHATDLLPLASVRPRAALATVELSANAPVRLLVHGRPAAASLKTPGGAPLPAARRGTLPGAAVRPAPAVALQATRPGGGVVRVGGRAFGLSVLGLLAFDGSGRRVDLAREHASFVRRAAPRELGAVEARSARRETAADIDDDLRFVVAGLPTDLPPNVRVESWGSDGGRLGEIEALTLVGAPCPPGVDMALRCAASRPLRVVATAADGARSSRSAPAILGELGGAISLRSGDLKLGVIRVAGPRQSRVGAIERVRAVLRATLVRQSPAGAPPIGDDDRGALSVIRGSVAQANALWASCGVSFGDPSALAVRLVDPPPPHLLAVGCGLGLPASGGQLRLRADGKLVTVAIAAGALPREVARRAAVGFERAGFVVRTADTPPVGPAVFGGTDLSIRTSDGRLVALSAADGATPSTDATLGVCIGSVELADGLEHFRDVDAVVGTLEERTLLRAIDDGDPTTLDVVVVPGLGSGDRIGESFIVGAQGAPRNTVILDRAGLRPGRAGLTLAHEIGHLLLGDPGHPDDFGIDTPTRLMDADSDDISEHGATRLALAECVQAMVQSGPSAPAPLLRAWPLETARFRGATWLGGLLPVR